MDPTRSLIAKIAAHESWARTEDRAARTAPGRAALNQRFLDASDGDPQRAEHLRKAHFARLALKSSQARRKARDARLTAAILDQVATDAERALDDAGDAA